MVFVEASLFARDLPDYLSDDEYRLMQLALLARPDAGPIITASGGVRKLRWRAGGKGKRGGVRIIYYWARAIDHIYLLVIYGKGEKDNLSAADLRRIRLALAEMESD